VQVEQLPHLSGDLEAFPRFDDEHRGTDRYRGDHAVATDAPIGRRGDLHAMVVRIR
jgi:hypothetical protein